MNNFFLHLETRKISEAENLRKAIGDIVPFKSFERDERGYLFVFNHGDDVGNEYSQLESFIDRSSKKLGLNGKLSLITELATPERPRLIK